MRSDPPDATATYAFEDVVFDARAHRVLKAGHEVALEPKAYGVLLELLRAAGAAVSRDALLDAVWGHRHVTPAVLNRIVAMLRRALGDDADHPRLIRTVHGTGYSFIAPVSLIDASHAAVPTDGDGSSPATSAPSEAGVAAIGAIRAAAANGSHDATAVPNATPRRRWLFGAAVAAVAFVAAVVFALSADDPERPGDESTATLPATGTARAARRTLALLPPVIAGDDAADHAMALAYVDGLRAALARFPGVEVAGSQSARVAVLRAREPASAGALLGVEHVLRAQFARDGTGVDLDVELVRVADHRRVWHRRFSEPREQLFRTIAPTLDGIQLALATTAGIDPVRAAPLSAQDLYWRGVVELWMSEPGASQRAIALFEQALAIEPRFAVAHVGIAWAWRAAVARREVSLDVGAGKGRVAIARALEIDNTLVEAYVAEARLLTMQWRQIEAAAPIRKARALAPDDPFVLELTASLATHDGRPADAIAMRARLAGNDPLVGYHYVKWGQDLAAAGELDAALAKFDEAFALDASDPYPSESALRVLAAYGRLADAMTRVERDGSAFTDIYVRVTFAAIHIALDQLDEAERVLAALEPRPPEPPGYAESLLSVRWARGDFAGALRWIEGEGGVLVQDPWRSVLHAHALALAGRGEDALRTYAEVFADAGNRDQLAGTSWTVGHALGEFAHWAVLDRAHGGTGEAGLSYLQSRIAHMTKGGYRAPRFDYYRATEAALRGDVSSADALLGEALERGWRDPVALRTDLVWGPFREAPWFVARQAQLSLKLDEEKARYRGMKAGGD